MLESGYGDPEEHGKALKQKKWNFEQRKKQVRRSLSPSHGTFHIDRLPALISQPKYAGQTVPPQSASFPESHNSRNRGLKKNLTT